MYEEFFHLEKSPFRMNPDPNSLYMTPSHREAFAGLLYAISRRKGFVVLTGDAGTGKTSLLRALIQSTNCSRFSVVLTPRVSADEFLELALLDFGLTEVPPAKSQRIVKLQELLTNLRLQGIAPVLMVDEAHTLSPETLEEIRLLTNFETTEEKLLQIVLAGQNDLAGILNREDLRQLKQRIEVRMALKPLEPAEVGAYMQHRWTHAGSQTPLPFGHPAIALIAKASRGIPRLINSICDNCLLLAYASEESQIGVGHVQHVLQDFDLVGAGPNGNHLSEGAFSRPNGLSAEPARPMRRTSIAPRSFLGVEDDALAPQPPLAGERSSIAPRGFLDLGEDGPTAPSPALRWAERIRFGTVQKRERS